MLERFFGVLGSDLAIDLGTANTQIGVAGEGVVLDEPSVVAVEEGTAAFVAGGRAVGHLAKQMLGRTPGSISVVRPLSAGVITDFELCEAMLRYFFRKASAAPGRGVRAGLVAVPGSITPVEKPAVYNSAHRAGARELFLVSEAIAAAVGAGLADHRARGQHHSRSRRWYDRSRRRSAWETSLPSTSVRVGGDRMDQAIADYLRRRQPGIGMATAEQLRIDIGSAPPLAKELDAEVRGLDATTGLPRRFEPSSVELGQALASPLDDILDAIKTTLDGCSPDLAADLVDHGITVCGGAALLRQFDVLVAERIGLPARILPEARTIVATGMLTLLEDLAEWQQMLESSDDDV